MLEHRIKLRHLSCFLEVAARQSFGGAARHLHLTQPAVSKAIAELEEILETALFTRSRRGVFLTPEGDAFRQHAGATLSALRQGIDTLSSGLAKSGAVISVGVLPTVAGRLMPAAVQEAKAQGLDATIRILTGPNEYLLERLREGDLDIVVGRMGAPASMQGLSFEHLYAEEVLFLVRPGHPLADGASVALPDLARFTILLPGAGAVIRPAVEELLMAYGGLRLPDVIETVSPSFGRRYTRGTDAVWVISHGVVDEDLDSGALIRLPIAAKAGTGSVGLTRLADMALPLPAERLIQSIRRVAIRIVRGDAD